LLPGVPPLNISSYTAVIIPIDHLSPYFFKPLTIAAINYLNEIGSPFATFDVV